jgi:hypothetical protein
MLINTNYIVNTEPIALLQKTICQAITSVLWSISDSCKGLIDFCTETKHYENTQFLLPEFQKHYYEEKAKYLLKSFAKDLMNKLAETTVSHAYSSELTIF